MKRSLGEVAVLIRDLLVLGAIIGASFILYRCMS
jgi:hypothetical protein